MAKTSVAWGSIFCVGNLIAVRMLQFCEFVLSAWITMSEKCNVSLINWTAVKESVWLHCD